MLPKSESSPLNIKSFLIFCIRAFVTRSTQFSKLETSVTHEELVKEEEEGSQNAKSLFGSYWTGKNIPSNHRASKVSKGMHCVCPFPSRCFQFFPFTSSSSYISLSFCPFYRWCLKGNAMAQPLVGENILMAAHAPEEYRKHCGHRRLKSSRVSPKVCEATLTKDATERWVVAGF